MATWNPQYTAPENVNGGNDFNGQNGVNATDMNACFNNAFYAAQQASNAVTTASNAASTASGAVTTANAALSKANEAIEKAEDAVVGVATTTELGGIKIGYSENGNNYPVELDSNNRAFVNVPSSKSTLTIESGDESYSFSESDTTQKLSFSGCSLNSFSLGAGERTISVNFNRMAGTTLEGLVKLTTTGHQSVAANSISSTAGRTYAVQYNDDQQLVVNVPWTDTDTNTTYSAGTGLSLSGTTFSIANMITGNVDWANSSINSLPTLFHLEYSGGDCNVAFSSTSGVANVVTDGHFYGDEGQRRCAYTDELTWRPINVSGYSFLTDHTNAVNFNAGDHIILSTSGNTITISGDGQADDVNFSTQAGYLATNSSASNRLDEGSSTTPVYFTDGRPEPCKFTFFGNASTNRLSSNFSQVPSSGNIINEIDARINEAMEGGSPASLYYGTCSTAAGIANKVVECSGFVLQTGAKILVYMENACNNLIASYLNVNNTGNKLIRTSEYNNGANNAHSSGRSWRGGDFCLFVYNGSVWIWVINNPTGCVGGKISYGNVTSGNSIDEDSDNAIFVTVWGEETSQYGTISLRIGSSSSSIVATTHGEDGYWGKNTLCVSAIAPQGLGVYVTASNMGTLSYSRTVLR